MGDIEKRTAWFNEELQPVRQFQQANLEPIIKSMQATTAEVVAGMYGEPYPRIEELTD